MLVKDLDKFLSTKCGYMRFEKDGEPYVIPHLEDTYYQAKTAIVMICRADGYNDIARLGNNITLTRSAVQEYNVLLCDGSKLYDFPELKEQNGIYTGELNPVHPLVCADYLTLNMISEHASGFGINYCGYDFNDAQIITKVNGVVVDLKPENIHFTIDEAKNGDTHYNVVLDIKTK